MPPRPQLDVKWLEAVLPYADSLNPESTGELARALLPEIMKVRRGGGEARVQSVAAATLLLSGV